MIRKLRVVDQAIDPDIFFDTIDKAISLDTNLKESNKEKVIN